MPQKRDPKQRNPNKPSQSKLPIPHAALQTNGNSEGLLPLYWFTVMFPDGGYVVIFTCPEVGFGGGFGQFCIPCWNMVVTVYIPQSIDCLP